MSVTAIKQTKRPVDPLRQALEAALEEESAAQEALQAQRAAVTKLRRAVWDAEKAHETAEKGVRKALQAAGEEMALAAADADEDDAPPSVSAVKLARAALVDAGDHVEACRVARDAVRNRIADYEAAASSATAAAEAVISQILSVPAQLLIDRLRALIAEATPLRRLLRDLLDGHRDRDVPWHGRRPIEAVLAAAADIVMQISDADVDNVAGVWKAARASLRQDPYAVLPDFTALSASPPPPSAA